MAEKPITINGEWREISIDDRFPPDYKIIFNTKLDGAVNCEIPPSIDKFRQQADKMSRLGDEASRVAGRLIDATDKFNRNGPQIVPVKSDPVIEDELAKLKQNRDRR